MKLLIKLLIFLIIVITFYSCAGVSVGTSFGVGYVGGPYGGYGGWGGYGGYGVYPRVNVGIYGGGYWR